MLVTTKVYARIVCPIRYEWVRDLLPKLHEFNAHDLSSVARREAREDARKRWTNKENVKHLKGECIACSSGTSPGNINVQILI